MSEWVKVSEKLPPINTWVLFIDGNNTMCREMYHIDKINNRKECLVNYLHNYSHWMSLPALPKEKADENQ